MLFAGLDIFLLTVMAYDCFMAICHPLNYTVIMNPQLCGLLVLVSWMMSVLNSLLLSLLMLWLSFCRILETPRFFCELNQVVLLVCSDVYLNDIVMYFAAAIFDGVSLTGILYSDSKVVSAILGSHQLRGSIRHFPPVHLISQWPPYFIVQP